VLCSGGETDSDSKPNQEVVVVVVVIVVVIVGLAFFRSKWVWS
jgi:hypothetical protein